MDIGKVSIVIPSRNEPYLTQTIKDLLAKAEGDIEIIAILDGYWFKPEEFVDDKRVIYLHFGSSRGMRNGITSAVELAKGEFILKSDAHCMFSKGYDRILKESCENNWVVVPRRYALNPEKWEIEDNPKYPIDYMYLSRDFHGMPWTQRNRDKSLESTIIDDLMSAQGSCWFMKKDYFKELELLDEDTYGKFWNEFQEIGLKAWLSGGAVKVNKAVWYAHWHKTEGRGYSLSDTKQEQAVEALQKWKEGDGWSKQTMPFDWLYTKFGPIPEK